MINNKLVLHNFYYSLITNILKKGKKEKAFVKVNKSLIFLKRDLLLRKEFILKKYLFYNSLKTQKDSIGIFTYYSPMLKLSFIKMYDPSNKILTQNSIRYIDTFRYGMLKNFKISIKKKKRKIKLQNQLNLKKKNEKRLNNINLNIFDSEFKFNERYRFLNTYSKINLFKFKFNKLFLFIINKLEVCLFKFSLFNFIYKKKESSLFFF